MRFLVTTINRSPMPPEAAAMLVPAMKEWAARHSASGVFEQIWSFAGLQGGGGIANVDSLEQLDSVMAEFPFGPFSEIHVYGLADVNQAMDNFDRLMQMRAVAMADGG